MVPHKGASLAGRREKNSRGAGLSAGWWRARKRREGLEREVRGVCPFQLAVRLLWQLMAVLQLVQQRTGQFLSRGMMSDKDYTSYMVEE